MNDERLRIGGNKEKQRGTAYIGTCLTFKAFFPLIALRWCHVSLDMAKPLRAAIDFSSLLPSDFIESEQRYKGSSFKINNDLIASFLLVTSIDRKGP